MAETDQIPVVDLADTTQNDDAPISREALLKRAQELGPSRMTWESIVLSPTDPILKDKMQPRVAERRARFRKMVKVALGTCVAFCLVATAATALSSNSSDSSDKKASATREKTAPAAAIVPVEKLEIVTHTKAAPATPPPSHVYARHASPKSKRR